MKPDERNIEEVLRRSLPSAPRGQMEAALDRVFARLQSDRGGTAPLEVMAQVDPPKRWREGGWWKPVTAATAALLVGAIWIGLSLRDGVLYAVLETPDSSVYRIVDGSRVPVHVGERIGAQESVQSNGGTGAVLALTDGSRVEMRSQSELSLERADDGARIRLRTGSIIVNAAKQPNGHLYVQTKDMTVTVVGTVFLVNAENEGSRVAVIEGEVRVQERATETKVRPGEQVSTSPTLAARSVKEEIAWSRQADAYLSILTAFEKGMADTSGPLRPLAANQTSSAAAGAVSAQAPPAKPQFEEASIRLCDPDNLPAAPAGARGGGANSFQMTPGRTHALCLTLATIIRHAYGYGPADLDFLNPGGRGRGFNMNNVYGLGVEDGRRIRGGPDWVRADHYTIEAVADGAADAATMSGPMMRELLERRFQLKTHIETEQVPAFSLTVAKGGLKIKPVSADGVQPDGFIRAGVANEACDALPPPTPGQPATRRWRTADEVRRGAKPNCGLFGSPTGPNMVFVAGGTTIGALGRALGSPLGGVQVVDKTGNADKFNFILEYVIDENTPGPRFLARPAPESSDIPRAQTIFSALEDQLGLKLEPSKAPRDFIVIDQVERPSPN